MVKRSTRTRLLSFPNRHSPAGGRLDALYFLYLQSGSADLIMEYQELQITSEPVLAQYDGRPREEVQGIYQPRRLRFQDAQIAQGEELCGYLGTLPADHPDRSLKNALTWRTPEGENYFFFGIHNDVAPLLLFKATGCNVEELDGLPQSVAITRDWSPSPSSPARLVPRPRRLHQRYGGDPVGIHLNGRYLQRRLFTGGVEIQSESRPDVEVVLNVGEVGSRWGGKARAKAHDRWEQQGEGATGMGVDKIAQEAQWVIEHLQAGKRVLVHCAAGMNRSATICCAVLILLEGLSAEAALERVRQHHPWALPDAYHWLALRWLAEKQNG